LGTAVLWASSYYFFRKLTPRERRTTLRPNEVQAR
jgi:hypothetical protein